MRDPNRIPSMLAAVEAAWRRDPDMRLGQLIGNAAWAGGWRTTDLFLIEDDQMLAGLEAFKERP